MSTVSHHLLRRRARTKANKLNALAAKVGPGRGLSDHYTVERAERGPWRWRVVAW